jgi:AcrR family transcriptional regulator
VLAATDGDAAAVRAHILDAAVRVITERDLAAASTRAIAEAAGLASGTLYNYFDSHTHLVARAIVHHAQAVTAPIAALPNRAGTATVARNLLFFVEHAAHALDRIVPLFAAAFSDAALLEALRRELADAYPLDDPAQAVERYLRAERRLGRVARNADWRAAASIVVSLCHDDAFQRHLHGVGGGQRRSRTKEINLLARSLTAPS